jgi:oligopeptidase B
MTEMPPPPSAPRRPHRLEAHGDVRVDDWYWLNEKDNPEVITYLEAENRYAEALLAPTAELQEQLFEGIKSRVQEDDVSVPSRHHRYWYWSATEEGAQYARYHRLLDERRELDSLGALDQARSGTGEVVLDENVLAQGEEYFSLGVFDIDPTERILAYATDTDGSELYDLRFKDLDSGKDLDDVIEAVYYGSAWAATEPVFFYVRPDEAMRPYQVWSHRLGSDPANDRLVYEEPDERFFVGVAKTRSERFIIIHIESKLTSEVRYLDTALPDDEPKVVLRREQGVEYDVEHALWPGLGDVWLLRTNLADESGQVATNFALRLLPIGTDDTSRVLIEHRKDTKIEGVEAFERHVIVAERREGLEHLRVIVLDDLAQHILEQPDPVYSLTGALNAEWTTSVYRFGYTSLVTPISTIEYDIANLTRTTVKVQPVLGGYDATRFTSERIWAKAPDGVRVPISLVRRADVPLDSSAPLLLYGYGSYEVNIDPTFSIARLNLLERGVIFAIAHIRGGGELGREWHEDGRLEHKKNTFTDFIACAEHLIAEKYSSPDRLVIRGGSAGGLLVGAVINERPDLFAGVVAEVPFVDVLTTMSDASLPLTVTEWEEWGNPVDDASMYELMKSYSPYDNVQDVEHPAMFVTGGLNDPRVGYWEPAKWVAKMRTMSKTTRPILLRTEMGAGHGGVSGRYDAWRDEARVQAFILSTVGITA